MSQAGNFSGGSWSLSSDVLQGSSTANYSNSQSNQESSGAAFSTRFQRNGSGGETDGFYQSGQVSAGSYSNQSYSVTSNESDTTTTASSAPSYVANDTWQDSNSMSVTVSGTSGTQTASSAATYSWLNYPAHQAQDSGLGTSSWQTVMSGVTLPQGVTPPTPDSTSVPEQGAEQSGGRTPVPASPDLAMVAVTGKWIASQGQYAEKVTNNAVDYASNQVPQASQRADNPVAAPAGPMPTSICGLTNGANLTGDEADIQGAMAQEGNNDSPQVMVATATPPPLPPPAPSNSGGFLSGLWSSISNTASNAWDEVTMVSSYVWNHPAEAVQEASTGANEGAALMLNQATFGTCFQEEARQAEQDLGPTTTQIVRFCGSTAEICLVAAAAPAAGVSSATVLGGAGIGMALDAGHQAAQIYDGTRDGFDLGEMGGAGQVGAVMAVAGGAAPQVMEAAGLVMSADGVVNGVEEIAQGHTAAGVFDVAAGSLGILATARSASRGASAAEEGGALSPKGPGAGKLAAEEATAGEGAAGRRCAQQAADESGTIGCFAAGTHFRAPMGSRAIEEFVEGDYLLSCAENEESGEVRPRRVLRVMKRLATLVRLRVGGQTIRTTAEHLFWVKDQGWTSTKQLRAGDLLRSHDGRWVELEGWEWTDKIEVVYNMEVEDDHTYFVGKAAWGFSVWSHNQGECGGSTPALRKRNADGTFAKEDTPAPSKHTRASEYPHGNKPETVESVIAKHTDENSNVIDPKTGQIIPPGTKITMEHTPSVAEHWNTEGYNQSRAERAAWYEDEARLTPKAEGLNKSEGATRQAAGELFFRQDTGPNYSP